MGEETTNYEVASKTRKELFEKAMLYAPKLFAEEIIYPAIDTKKMYALRHDKQLFFRKSDEMNRLIREFQKAEEVARKMRMLNPKLISRFSMIESAFYDYAFDPSRLSKLDLKKVLSLPARKYFS